MNNNFIPLDILFIALFTLLLFSAFFSGSEAGMMSLNRYRLKYLSKTSKHARRAIKLLARPDRLLGVILIGNNFVNIAASAISTLIGVKLFGDIGILVSTIMLTICVLIFAEILPKTLGIIKPEQIALPATILLQLLLWLLFPFVWLVNSFSNKLLYFFGIKKHNFHDTLSIDELRTIVSEKNSLISIRHKRMVSSILELEQMTVDDIMIPRAEVKGIDLEDEFESIINRLALSKHTLLPIYRGELETVEGIIHMRDISKYLADDSFSIEKLSEFSKKPYFVPEGTSLHRQLINFQHNKTRLGLVVDEYGGILGLITLEDILEEIVGELTTDISVISREIHPQADGSFIIDGSINLRALNRMMNWELPTIGAKTLSGLIIDYLEAIPEPSTCVLIARYPIIIIHIQDNMVKTVKVRHRLPVL